MSTTTRQMKQTAERIDAGVAALTAELQRQSQAGVATLGDIDVRALYLVIDERAARLVEAASCLGIRP